MTDYLNCIRCGKETDERYSIFTPNKKVAHLYVDSEGKCVGRSWGVISRV